MKIVIATAGQMVNAVWVAASAVEDHRVEHSLPYCGIVQLDLVVHRCGQPRVTGVVVTSQEIRHHHTAAIS